VSGVVSGATVNLYADGELIGTAKATDTSVVITTDGSTALAEGAVSITATQTLEDQTVEVGNLNTTTDLVSGAASLTITVATTGPEFTFVPVTTAQENAQYTCTVTAESQGGAVTFALTDGPDGMTIDEDTGVITWTPDNGTSEDSPYDVTVEATDAAGNTAEKSFTVSVAGANTAAPELTAAYPSLGSTNEDTAFTIEVWEFINNGDGTTGITDEDEDAIVGGIAITAKTGSGTWAYSTDGETFVSIGTVSSSSAFLVPADAVLRYTAPPATAAPPPSAPPPTPPPSPSTPRRSSRRPDPRSKVPMRTPRWSSPSPTSSTTPTARRPSPTPTTTPRWEASP